MVVASFMEYSKTHYVKNGKRTGEYRTFARICKEITLDPSRAQLPAAKFTQHELRAIRELWINRNVRRSAVNKYTSKVRRVFRWACDREMIPDSVIVSLGKVKPIDKHEFGLRETKTVEPVGDDVLVTTIEHLTPTMAAMVRFQLCTGARPGEVVKLRPGLIVGNDIAGWEFKVEDHKVDKKSGVEDFRQYIGLSREALDIISPYMDRDDDTACFSIAQHITELPHEQRKFIAPSREFPDHFSAIDYYNAIKRVVIKVFPIPKGLDDIDGWKRTFHWTPNQLRHNAGTIASIEENLEAAQALLRHKNPATTLTYLGRRRQHARDVAQRLGPKLRQSAG